MSCCLGNGREPPFSLRPDRATAQRDDPAALTGRLRSDAATSRATTIRRQETWWCGDKAKFGGMDVSEAKRLRALEEENGKLKKLLAEQMLDAAALRELLSKKW